MADQWATTADHSPEAGSPAATGGWSSTTDHAPDSGGNKGTGSILGDFAAGAFSKVNPLAKVKQGVDLLKAVYNDPDGTVANFAKEVLAHPYVAMARGVDAAKAGKPEEAMAHFASALNPAGFLTEEAEAKAATPGQRARGFGELIGTGADAYLIPKIPDALANVAGGAKNLVTRPSVLRTVGTMAGAHVGGPVGAVLGREIAGDIAESLKKVPEAKVTPPPSIEPSPLPPAQPPPLPVEATPPPIPTPEGVDPKVWEKLPPAMQEQLRLKSSGATVSSRSAPAPQAPRDPSYYGVGNEPNTPVRPPIAEKPAEVPREALKEAPPGDLTQKLNDLLRKVKIEGGFDPDKPLGEVKGGRYLAKFDEGGGEAPVIQSQLRKPTSGVEPANPSLIAKDIGQKLAGRITVEQFDSMAKNPKALAVITRQYGVEADPDLIAMIRRRIKAKTADVPSNSVISIADLMRTK